MEHLLSPADGPLSPASPTFVKIDEPVSIYCKFMLELSFFFFAVVHSAGFDKFVVLSIQY